MPWTKDKNCENKNSILHVVTYTNGLRPILAKYNWSNASIMLTLQWSLRKVWVMSWFLRNLTQYDYNFNILVLFSINMTNNLKNQQKKKKNLNFGWEHLFFLITIFIFRVRYNGKSTCLVCDNIGIFVSLYRRGTTATILCVVHSLLTPHHHVVTADWEQDQAHTCYQFYPQ